MLLLINISWFQWWCHFLATETPADVYCWCPQGNLSMFFYHGRFSIFPPLLILWHFLLDLPSPLQLNLFKPHFLQYSFFFPYQHSPVARCWLFNSLNDTYLPPNTHLSWKHKSTSCWTHIPLLLCWMQVCFHGLACSDTVRFQNYPWSKWWVANLYRWLYSSLLHLAWEFLHSGTA